MSRPSVEQVAAEFFRVLSNVAGDPDDSLYDEQDSVIRQFEEATRAVLALFEPETVTTAAELDALPVGSVVLDRNQNVQERWPEGCWAQAGWSTFTASIPLPATVLHRGGDR